MGTNPYAKEHRIVARTREDVEFEYRQVEMRIHQLEGGAHAYGFMPGDFKRQLDDLYPKERSLKAKLTDVRARERSLRELHDEWERDNRDPDKAKIIPYEPDDEPGR